VYKHSAYIGMSMVVTQYSILVQVSDSFRSLQQQGMCNF